MNICKLNYEKDQFKIYDIAEVKKLKLGGDEVLKCEKEKLKYCRRAKERQDASVHLMFLLRYFEIIALKQDTSSLKFFIQ